jgi:hypothetical protein
VTPPAAPMPRRDTASSAHSASGGWAISSTRARTCTTATATGTTADNLEVLPSQRVHMLLLQLERRENRGQTPLFGREALLRAGQQQTRRAPQRRSCRPYVACTRVREALVVTSVGKVSGWVPGGLGDPSP